MSYIEGVIMSHRAAETMLTATDQLRIENIINDGATPMTEIETALVTVLNGKFWKWCPKLTAMANYAITLDGYKSIQAGTLWKSEADKLKDKVNLEKWLNASDHSGWNNVDFANYYCSKDDDQSKFLGRQIFRNIELDEEMEMDQKKFEKAHPKK